MVELEAELLIWDVMEVADELNSIVSQEGGGCADEVDGRGGSGGAA